MLLRPKRDLKNRRILITGASSGIGEALARQLAAFGARLHLTARRGERLRVLSDELLALGAKDCAFVVGDITQPSHRARVLGDLQQRWNGIDILINNAGIGGIGTFASASESRLRKIMEVNFFAPVELMRAALPALIQSDDGVIVNVSSVLGHFAVPKKSEYCASKFAMHGISDALRMELASTGVDLLLVSPSTTRSEFFEQALRSDGKSVSNKLAMTPDRVAKSTIHAIRIRRRETILSVGGRSLILANRVFPGFLSRILQRFA